MIYWVALVAFAGLALTLGNYPSWFDAPEFALAATQLGVSHPSGHAIYQMLAKLYTFLPFGSIAYRTDLLSLSSFAILLLLLDVFRPTQVQRLPLLLLCFAFFVHPSIAMQFSRTEVYAPHFLLLTISFLLSFAYLQTGDIRTLLINIFLLGLSFTLQPPLTLSAQVICVFAFLQRKPQFNLRLFTFYFLFFSLGLLAYLYLPLRALRQPTLNWDDPQTLQRLWAAITAKDFRVFFHVPGTGNSITDFSRAEVLKLIPWPLWVLTAFVGVQLFLRRYFKFLIFWIGATLVSLLSWLVKDFRMQNPDAHAYLMFPLFLLFLFPLFASATMLKPVRSFSIFSVVALLVTGLNLSAGLKAIQATRGVETELLSRQLDELPSTALANLTSDHWLFPYWYRSYVERRRPDVKIVGSELIPAKWYREQVQDRYPFATFSTYDETNHPNDSFSLNLFAQSCREHLWHPDPFEVNSSVCADVAAKISKAFVLSTDVLSGLQTFEQFLGIPLSQQCEGSQASLSLPFPLVRSNEPHFLTRASTIFTNTMMLYIQCGAASAAHTFSSRIENPSTNMRLLNAYAFFQEGNLGAALQALSPQTNETKRTQAYLLLASSTLNYLSGNLERAKSTLREIPQLPELTDSIQHLANLLNSSS